MSYRLVCICWRFGRFYSLFLQDNAVQEDIWPWGWRVKYFDSEGGVLRFSETSAAILHTTCRNIPNTWVFNRFLAPGWSLTVRSYQGCRICDNWFSLKSSWYFTCSYCFSFFLDFLYSFYQDNFLCVSICFLVFIVILFLQMLQIQTHIFVCICCFLNVATCFLQYTLIYTGKFVIWK
jgi:hypothetical protein